MSLLTRPRASRLWLVLAVAAAILVLALALTPSASATEDRPPGAAPVEIAPASGGISDSSLAAAVFIPALFLVATGGLLLWARNARAKPRDDEDGRAMPWWRTTAWYGRTEDDEK